MQRGCSSNGVTVRDATPEDNTSLLALDAACTMGRWRRWTIRHDPDFFALFRVAGVRSYVGAASDALGRLIGVVTIIEQPEAVCGGPANCYVSGWQVHPAHRGRGAGDALVAWALHRYAMIEAGAGRGWFFTAGSGDALRHRVQRLAPWAAISDPVALYSYRLPTHRRRSFPNRRRLRVRPSVAEDVPEMAALWNAIASARRLAPRLDVPAIERWRTGALGAAPACYWVARTEHGALAGFMGLWDQRAVKQFRLESCLPWRRERMVHCLAAAHVCVPPNDAETTRALLAAAADAARRAGYGWILVVADATDALSHAYREWGGAGARYTAFVVSASAQGDAFTDRRAMHVEAGLA